MVTCQRHRVDFLERRQRKRLFELENSLDVIQFIYSFAFFKGSRLNKARVVVARADALQAPHCGRTAGTAHLSTARTILVPC